MAREDAARAVRDGVNARGGAAAPVRQDPTMHVRGVAAANSAQFPETVGQPRGQAFQRARGEGNGMERRRALLAPAGHADAEDLRQGRGRLVESQACPAPGRSPSGSAAAGGEPGVSGHDETRGRKQGVVPVRVGHGPPRRRTRPVEGVVSRAARSMNPASAGGAAARLAGLTTRMSAATTSRRKTLSAASASAPFHGAILTAVMRAQGPGGWAVLSGLNASAMRAVKRPLD